MPVSVQKRLPEPDKETELLARTNHHRKKLQTLVITILTNQNCSQMITSGVNQRGKEIKKMIMGIVSQEVNQIEIEKMIIGIIHQDNVVDSPFLESVHQEDMGNYQFPEVNNLLIINLILWIQDYLT